MYREYVRRLCRLAALAAPALLLACNGHDSGTSATYSLSASVSGLTGTGLALANNGTGTVAVSANGTVKLASGIAAGASYKVTVATQPTAPAQTCTVTNGSGTAQGDVSNVVVACKDNYQPTYTPAPKGVAAGAATTQSVDATGGSLTSADGRITLQIPAGALAGPTQISVQPITSTVGNGVGAAYRLEPEGTTFAVPVTLTFHLSATEAPALNSTFVATQEANGLWYSQPHQQRDATAQTVSVTSTHFSDWTIAQTLELVPNFSRVQTNGSEQLTAKILIVSPDDDLLASPAKAPVALPEPVVLDQQLNGTKIWKVDDVIGGYDTVGFISDPGKYDSPYSEPSPNQVIVSLTLQFDSEKTWTPEGKVIAIATVEIYAHEVWDGSTDVTQVDGSKAHADVTFGEKDVGSNPARKQFVVTSGVVTVEIPTTNPQGCPQSISPTSHTIGAGEGSMQVTYPVPSDPSTAQVTGNGISVWQAVLTVDCPNGTQTIDTSVSANWWPSLPGDPPLTATNGEVAGTVDDGIAHGTIHFVRQ
ncbi:MAG: hypothetical protein JSS29_16125 [Proteobacteria bacterium]|nr:hypothetical protein [Pseudomonadota bacterium]